MYTHTHNISIKSKYPTRNKTYALKGIAVYYNHHLNCCGSTNGLNVRYTQK